MDVSSHPDFDSYQRKIVNNLGYFALSLQYFGRGQGREGRTSFIKSSSFPAQFLFYLTVSNSLIKVAYISYLFNGQFSGFEFLDKISTSLYTLVFGIMTISYSIWLKRYPLYEIIQSLWTIEKSIFERLGEPTKLKREVDNRHKATVWIHLGITWIGCFCFIVQYYADPKYCTFTYAFFENENWILFTLFGAHEFLFMLHAWNLMTGSNCLFTFQSIALSNIIREMTKKVDYLSLANKLKLANSKQKKPLWASSSTAHENHYNVDQIIFDYKQLMLLTDLYNDYVSYKTVFLHICGYCQFISDVFLAVQILRLPGTSVLDIWFYIEDSLASMYMIYRVYENMSKVHPASMRFFRALNHYLEDPFLKSQERKYLHKTIKSLTPVSIKIGPCPVIRPTVLSAMEILGNYYICVALWR